MTISDRVFERLSAMGMSQKRFAEEAGITQSTISEWKKNHTNPSSDKIMPICRVLGVSPEWLLSGVDRAGARRREQGVDYLIIERETELWRLVEEYKQLDIEARNRVMGYVDAVRMLVR